MIQKKVTPTFVTWISNEV